MKLVAFYPDEHFEIIDQDDDDIDILTTIQTIVRGWIENYLPDSCVAGLHHIYLNEEGLLIPRLTYNRYARHILHQLGYNSSRWPLGGPAGVVVLIGASPDDGDDTSLSQETIDHIINVVIPQLIDTGVIQGTRKE